MAAGEHESRRADAPAYGGLSAGHRSSVGSRHVLSIVSGSLPRPLRRQLGHPASVVAGVACRSRGRPHARAGRAGGEDAGQERRQWIGWGHATDSDGHRAHGARRARVRHLLAAAQRAHHLPGHADRRPGGEPGGGAAAAPRERGPREGHLDLHQLAGRLDLLGPGDLRHDELRQAGHRDDVRGRGDVDGLAAAGWRAPRASARCCRTRAS